MAIVTRYGVTGEEQMVEAYGRARAAGCPAGVTSSWRNPTLQKTLFVKNYTPDYWTSSMRDRRPWNDVPYWRRKQYADHVSVAVPDTSLHEKGLALDLPGDKTDPATPRGWMHKHGRPFGFIWPDWAQRPATYEDWHFEYDASQDTMEEEMAFTDDDRAMMREIRDIVRPGKAGRNHDGELPTLVKSEARAAKAAAEAATSAAKAATESADKALRADTRIAHTPTSRRIIEAAGGTVPKDPVRFGDAAAYAQALAIEADKHPRGAVLEGAEAELEELDVAAIAQSIATALMPTIGAAVAAALTGTTGTLTFDKEQ